MSRVLLLVLMATYTWASVPENTNIAHPSYVADLSNETKPCHNVVDTCVVQDGADYSYVCERASSLDCLFDKYRGENRKVRLAVSVRHVDGDLNLNPPSSVILVSLSLLGANVTSIKYDTTEDKHPLGSLVRLDLRDNPKLESSWLKGSLPSLQELDLKGTDLREEGLKSMLRHLPVLQCLSLASANLDHLPEDIFNKNPQLEKLNLANNILGKITLKESLIRKLTSLNLSNCSLTKISVSSSSRSVMCSVDICRPRLRMLDVSDNSLTWLPMRLLKAVPKNSFIKIAGNKWACDSCRLYYLQESAKNVTHVDGLDQLTTCNPKDLRTCTWNDCPEDCSCDERTKTVNCTEKGLDSVPLVGPADTRTLLLDNNFLKNIEGLTSPSWCNLESLSLNNNSVTNIVPKQQSGSCRCISHGIHNDQDDCYPQNLRKLHLNNNNIKRFTESDCGLLYPIKTLSLANNKIARPSQQFCGSLRNLMTLNLAHNDVKAIHTEDLIQYPSIRRLNLTENSVGNVSVNASLLLSILEVKAPDSLLIFLDYNSSLCKNLEHFFQKIPKSIQLKIENCGNSQHKIEATTTARPKRSLGLVSIVILLVTLTFLTSLWICGTRPMSIQRSEAHECTYSVYVVHSPRDCEMVRTNVIIPLIQRGYNVAWPEGTFKPGDLILENIEKTIRKSEKMLVVATENLPSDKSCLMEIRRGRHEELERNGSFKIMALVTESLPRELPQDLFDIIALRTSVPYSNTDYIEKICNFLSLPRPPLPPEVHQNIAEMRETGNCDSRPLVSSPMSAEEYVRISEKYQRSPKLGRLTPEEMESLEYVLITQETEGIDNVAFVEDSVVSASKEPEAVQDQFKASISEIEGSFSGRFRFSIVNSSCRF